MSISETAEQLLLANGFKPARAATKKKSSWLMPKSGEVFYVNRASHDGVSLFIFHPEKSRHATEAVRKSGLEFGEGYFHSSNMTMFPKRQNKGVNLIPYGCPVNTKGLNQINNLIAELK